jgi:hypothetical protein
MYFVGEKYRKKIYLKISPHSFLSRLDHSSQQKFIFYVCFHMCRLTTTTTTLHRKLLKSLRPPPSSLAAPSRPLALKRNVFDIGARPYRHRSANCERRAKMLAAAHNEINKRTKGRVINRGALICRCKWLGDAFGSVSVFRGHHSWRCEV